MQSVDNGILMVAFVLQGNPANHTVIFDNNLVDYVNHMLRAARYQDVASTEQVTLHTTTSLRVSNFMLAKRETL